VAMPFGWIFATLTAAGFQVLRNGLQRGLIGTSGPWGATLVRFLFGLPFSLLMAGVAALVTRGAAPNVSSGFLLTCALGATSQVFATAALLAAMNRSGFAVATSLQQSSLPLAALIGLYIFHDTLSAPGWIGVAVTTAGLVALTWPRGADIRRQLTGAGLGLVSGLLFGFSLNAFRHAGLALEPHHPVFAAMLAVPVVQTLQSLGLGLILLVLSPSTVVQVFRDWRRSSLAGLCGSLASAGWFVALALAPAASVRAVGVIEAPMAAIAGHRLFKERLHWSQWLSGALVAAGVVMTALG
jgi:drug/metabolite transporter (DMT)-like permease